MTEEKKPRRKRKQPEASKRLSEQQLNGLGDIFPGFAEWYRQSHDEDGKLLPSARMPGLIQTSEEEQ